MISEQVNFVSIPRTGTRSILNVMPYENGGFSNHKSINLTKDERFSFAVIRHPLRRLVSWYKYHNFPQYDPNGEIYGSSFNEWVNRGCPHHWSDEQCDDRGISSPLVQSDFVCDFGGDVIVDKLLDYENLQKEFDISLQPYLQNTILPIMNPAPRGSVSISLDTQQIIWDLFAKDYKLYSQITNNNV